jgi:hypothetical protein
MPAGTGGMTMGCDRGCLWRRACRNCFDSR